MVAIPTGIISAGFVDQYSTIKKRMEYGYESDMSFIRVFLENNDPWIGKKIYELKLSSGIIVAAIRRKEKFIVPRGDVVLMEDDTVILGAEPYHEHAHINLKEIVLQDLNPWVGMKIKDLDISRHSLIVLVKRKNKALIPNGNMILRDGDNVFLYTDSHLPGANDIEI